MFKNLLDGIKIILALPLSFLASTLENIVIFLLGDDEND